MFARNDKISNRQQNRMLVLDMFSISSLIVPYVAVNSANVDGIIVVVFGTFLGIFYATILYLLGSKFVDKRNNMQPIEFMNYSRQTVGSLVTGLIGVLYLVKFFLLLTFTSSLFTHVIGGTLLSQTNPNVILALLLLVSGYGAMHGIEKRARLTEILYFFVLVPIILYLILGVSKIDLSNLFIAANTKNQFKNTGVIWGSYFILLTFTALDGIIFTQYYMNSNTKRRSIWYVIGGVVTIGIVDSLIYLVTVGILGVGEAGNKIWSLATIMEIIEIPGNFVRRQDKIMLVFWMLGIFSVLSFCMFYMVKVTRDFIEQCFLKNFKMDSSVNKYFVLVYGLLTFALATSMNNIEVQFSQFGKYMLYIGMPQSILIPLFLIGMNKLRRENVADVE